MIIEISIICALISIGSVSPKTVEYVNNDIIKEFIRKQEWNTAKITYKTETKPGSNIYPNCDLEDEVLIFGFNKRAYCMNRSEVCPFGQQLSSMMRNLLSIDLSVPFDEHIYKYKTVDGAAYHYCPLPLRYNFIMSGLYKYVDRQLLLPKKEDRCTRGHKKCACEPIYNKVIFENMLSKNLDGEVNFYCFDKVDDLQDMKLPGELRGCMVNAECASLPYSYCNTFDARYSLYDPYRKTYTPNMGHCERIIDLPDVGWSGTILGSSRGWLAANYDFCKEHKECRHEPLDNPVHYFHYCNELERGGRAFCQKMSHAILGDAKQRRHIYIPVIACENNDDCETWETLNGDVNETVVDGKPPMLYCGIEKFCMVEKRPEMWKILNESLNDEGKLEDVPLVDFGLSNLESNITKEDEFPQEFDPRYEPHCDDQTPCPDYSSCKKPEHRCIPFNSNNDEDHTSGIFHLRTFMPYKTNQPCDPTAAVPHAFGKAYCTRNEPHRIVFLHPKQKKGFAEERRVINCNFNNDCFDPENVCVFEKYSGQCYRDPFLPGEQCNLMHRIVHTHLILALSALIVWITVAAYASFLYDSPFLDVMFEF